MLNKAASLDRTFQALADSTRRAILSELTRGPSTVTTLARPLAMSLPAVMQHLAVLEESGLVRSEKIGRVRTCRIDAKALALAEQWINQRRSEWERRFDRLGDYLETLQSQTLESQTLESQTLESQTLQSATPKLEALQSATPKLATPQLETLNLSKEGSSDGSPK